MKTLISYLQTAFIMLVLLQFANGQSNYSDIPLSYKNQVFFDDFSDNRTEWSLATDGIFVRKIENGNLFLQSKNDMAQLLSKSIPFDETKDFEIETKIKFLTGTETSGNALLWGKTEEKDYGFYYTVSKSFKIAKYDNGYVDFIPFKSTESIKKFEYNKLTIRKVGKTIYFFMNESLLYNMPFEPFFGKRIGFQVATNSQINVDYLLISTLSSARSNENTDQEPERLIPQNNNMTYAWINSKKVTPIFTEEFSDNSKSWGTGQTSDIKRSIENGSYYFETFIESFYSAYKDVIISQNRDFQIETAIKFNKGNENFENCLLWGGSDNGSFRLGVTGNGYYCAYKIESSTITTWLDYKNEPWIKYKEYNKFTVRKIGSTYYFFINEKLIHTRNFESFSGNRIGFLVGKTAAIYIDYLRVTYIN